MYLLTPRVSSWDFPVWIHPWNDWVNYHEYYRSWEHLIMVENNLNLFIRFYHPKTWNPILILIELPPPIGHIDRYHIQKLVQNIWCWSYPPRKPWNNIFHWIHLFNSYPRILCLERIHTVREDSIITSKPYLSEISLINNSPILGLSPWTLLFIPPMNHRLIGIELRVLYTIGSK